VAGACICLSNHYIICVILNWPSVEFLSDSTHPISYQMLTVWSQCRCFRWHMSHGTSTFSMIRPCIPIMEWLSIADSKYKKCLNSNALSCGSITWHDRGHCNSKIHYISRQPLIPFFFSNYDLSLPKARWCKILFVCSYSISNTP